MALSVEVLSASWPGSHESDTVSGIPSPDLRYASRLGLTQVVVVRPSDCKVLLLSLSPGRSSSPLYRVTAARVRRRDQPDLIFLSTSKVVKPLLLTAENSERFAD